MHGHQAELCLFKIAKFLSSRGMLMLGSIRARSEFSIPEGSKDSKGRVMKGFKPGCLEQGKIVSCEAEGWQCTAGINQVAPSDQNYAFFQRKSILLEEVCFLCGFSL